MFEKLDMKTINFTDENIKKLAEIFPNVVSEDENGKVIDFEALKQELSGNIVEGYKERYSLNWPGKRQAQLSANTPTTKTLRPCIEESVNFDTTENLYIEGDNLEVLKILQESYLNKIKMIYIDPPYNTGNDFIYSDNFDKDAEDELFESGQIDENGGRLVANPDSNGRYHSDWLSMIYPRLKLARNLLKEDGLIFISIDYRELTNLKKVMDEIFGEDNFVNQLSIKMSELSGMKMKNLTKYPKLAEYILIYSKNSLNSNIKIEKVEKQNLDNYLKYYSKIISNIEQNCEGWEIISLTEYFNQNNMNLNTEEIKQFKIDNAEKIVYRTNSKTVDKYIESNPNSPSICKFKNSDGNDVIKWDNKEMLFLSNYILEPLSDIWTDISTINLNKETNDIPTYFNGQKPIKLLKRLIKATCEEDDLVLDFFSGSSSTAQAIIDLKDELNLKYIMVQIKDSLDETLSKVSGDTKKNVVKMINFLDSINQPHYITEIGKERIRRAGKKIVEESGRTDLDIGFRVLKLDDSNMKDIYFTPQELGQSQIDYSVDNIKEDRSDLDLLFGVLIDWGVDLTLPIKKEVIQGKDCYFVDRDSLCAYFGNNINEEFIKELAKKEALRFVFKDSSFGNNDDLKDNVSQIFKQLNPSAEIKVI